MSEGSRTMEIMRELGMSLGQPMIAVVGCGGAGNNIVDAVYWRCPGVHTVVVNDDRERLEKVNAHRKIALGSLAGVDSCGLPEFGERCAEEHADDIRQEIEGYDIVFVVAGLGGGLGSGAAPVVARLARQSGCIVFAVPVMPFSIEGGRRAIAALSLEQLNETSHVVLPLDNDKLQDVCGEMTISAAFSVIERSIIRIIEKVHEHSSSYVSDLLDEFSAGFASPIEEIVTSEHQMVMDEITMRIHASLEHGLEYPFNPGMQDPDDQWNDMMFG